MNRVVTIIALCIFSYALKAQQITGKVVEAETKEAVSFAGVFLLQATDTTFVQNQSTDENGQFAFDAIAPGRYIIEIRFIGFETYTTPPLTITNEDQIALGTINLNVGEFSLDAVEVTATNPTYVNAADRKIYYPGQDINAQSGSATDALQNIPSVSVELEGEVLLRGSGNVTFLLNGKTSGLLKNDPAAFLQQLPANSIERIEVITNPSAKFRPDGTAGIINIITKKNVIPGFNGNILLNASTGRRYNGNLSMNYNPGKFNIGINAGYWQNYSPRTYTDYRINRDTFFESETIFDLKNDVVGKMQAPRASLSFDFIPNEKSSLGAFISYRQFEATRNENVITLESNDSGFLNDYTTNRNEDDEESEIELSLYGEQSFAEEDHAISFEASFYNNIEDEIIDFADRYRFPSYPEFLGANTISNKEDGKTLSLDYTNPLSEELKLELGYEGEFLSGDFDFYSEFFDRSEMIWKNDVLKTNRFIYTQDLHAGYITLSQALDAFTILGGLRGEQTNIGSNLITLDSVIPNNYFKIFPTLHLQYELNKTHQLSLSYSRRIHRPDPDDLNPFPEYVDIRDIDVGNPNLKPEQTHSIELGYHFQDDIFSFVPTAYYRYTYDALTEVSYYINDSTLLTTKENLDTKISGGMEFVLGWSPFNKINFNLSSNLYYQQIDATNLNYASGRSIITADSKLAANFTLFPNTKLQANASYRGGGLRPQGRSLPVYFLNMGLKQELFKKKASLTLTVSDVFNTMKWRYIIDSPDLYQEVSHKRKSQIVYLGFSYRFGFISKKQGEEMLFDDRM